MLIDEREDPGELRLRAKPLHCSTPAGTRLTRWLRSGLSLVTRTIRVETPGGSATVHPVPVDGSIGTQPPAKLRLPISAWMIRWGVPRDPSSDEPIEVLSAGPAPGKVAGWDWGARILFE